MRRVVFSLSLLLLFTKTGSAAPLEVPFIAQKPNYCGPAALAMLANFYGLSVSQDDIASAIYLPDIGGSLTIELANYARRYNLWVRQYGGWVDDLRQKLNAGVPVLVLGKFGDRPHYFIVLDWDDFRQVVTVHSDARPRFEMRVEDFMRHWDRAHRWTLMICPPEKATWRLSAEEHNDLGVFLERAGSLGPATLHYVAATQLRPDNSYFRMNLGNALLKQRRLREAADTFARAVELDSQNTDAMNNLAYAYLEMGKNLDDAARLCQEALTLRPSHSAYYLDTLGAIYLKQGRSKEAVATLEAALAAMTDRQSSLRPDIEQRLAAARAMLSQQPLVEK